MLRNDLYLMVLCLLGGLVWLRATEEIWLRGGDTRFHYIRLCGPAYGGSRIMVYDGLQSQDCGCSVHVEDHTVHKYYIYIYIYILWYPVYRICYIISHKTNRRLMNASPDSMSRSHCTVNYRLLDVHTFFLDISEQFSTFHLPWAVDTSDTPPRQKLTAPRV